MNPEKFVNFVRDELGLTMENKDKVTRAVQGTATGRGLEGGVGEEASAVEILAKYDQIGGYITKDGYKVKNGIFFDSKTKKPLNPEKITLLVYVNGNWVENIEGEEETLEVKIAKKQMKESKKGGKKGGKKGTVKEIDQ